MRNKNYQFFAKLQVIFVANLKKIRPIAKMFPMQPSK
jgi:hypothetical protein